MKWLLALALLLPLAASAKTGEELLADCRHVADLQRGEPDDEAGRIAAAKCLAFLQGFGGADALSPLTRKGQRMFCIPKTESLREAARRTVDWMDANPGKLHFGAHEVLAMANIVNYPCTAPTRP